MSVPILNIENASVVRGSKTILDNIRLRVNDGEHIAIVGPNGSGKSTLIKLITREHYPAAGEGRDAVIELFGRDRWDVFELRAQLGILSGDVHQSFVADDSLNALETVVSGFFASKGIAMHQKVTSEMVEAAKSALRLVGVEQLASRLMATLSTGEARRVMIARALVSDPKALILDEPTAGLDLAARRRFLHTIREITHRTSKTVILVTHHVEEIIPEIRRVVLMKDGKIFLDGVKDDVLTRANLSALFDETIELRQNAGFYSAEAGIL